MIIYNLFPLLAGNVRDWTPHLERAASLGFDWVFVNPIHYPGYSGSLYSVKDFFSMNPLFVDGATPRKQAAEFKKMVKVANKLGLKLMVDLVVSHCAFDSDLTKKHPKWFKHEGGRIAHPWCMENEKKVVWKDLAQFDHKHTPDKEGLFQYLAEVVEFLIELGVQGFRCDAAYQVPEAFWKRLIEKTRKAHPEVLFLAETLGCVPKDTVQTARAGFDYVFNSAKWWDFSSPWLLEQYTLTRDVTKSVSFPESHDTLRLLEEVGGDVEAVKRQYLFNALFSAGVMMPIGFEFGFRKRLHVVETRPTDWEQTGVDLGAFVKAVNKVKAENPVFREEAPTEVLYSDNPNVLYLWKGSLKARQEALIILNKDRYNKQHFRTQNLYQAIQAKGPLYDISPEYSLDYLPTPYEYGLRPSQVIVLVTKPVAA